MKREFINKLKDWKESKNRKPLIIHGARQIGKTYIVKEFAKQYYDNLIYVNFETNHELNFEINDNIEPKYIIQKLELFYSEKIIPGKTLIFFDEIQANERALTSLKYFNENANEYHVIAAGSLLGIAINRQNYSFPVGKVQIFDMYPLSFKEFLIALGKEDLVNMIIEHYNKNERMDLDLHEYCLKLYRLYLVVGGMPEVINTYMQDERIIDIIDAQGTILESYVRDMTKYSTGNDSNKIIATFDSIPVQLAKENHKFQYKVISKGGSASIFGPSIMWLKNSGIINQVYKVNPILPLEMYKDMTAFKIYMSDVGLFVNKARYPLYNMDSLKDNSLIAMGPITENYVANELKINGYTPYYWESQGKAEIDFVIQKDIDIVPIEVKANIHVKSRSLNLFMNKYNSKYGIRLSEKNFGLENNIKSVPLYAVFCI